MDTKFEISVEGEELADIEIISLPEGATGRDIIIVVAERSAFSPDEAILLIEDGDEAIDIEMPLTESAIGRVHHVHRAREIEVGVFYLGNHKAHKFRPSARVQRVLDWAVGPEGIQCRQDDRPRDGACATRARDSAAEECPYRTLRPASGPQAGARPHPRCHPQR